MLARVFPLFLIASSVTADGQAAKGELERPNVIFIVLDDAHREQFNYLPEGSVNSKGLIKGDVSASSKAQRRRRWETFLWDDW